MSDTPLQPFRLLQERPHLRQLEEHERVRICSRLDAENPLNSMPREAFLALLETVHACAVLAHGQVPRTSTRIQFDVARRILRGELPGTNFSHRFERLWDWPELAKLEADPLFACCYMRLRTMLGAAPARSAEASAAPGPDSALLSPARQHG